MYSTDFREAVSVIEAARLIGVCRSRLYELLKDGDLKSIKLGKRRLVVRRSISELIRKLEAQAEEYATRKHQPPRREKTGAGVGNFR
jgi:excisionase family DNA binding protein